MPMQSQTNFSFFWQNIINIDVNVQPPSCVLLNNWIQMECVHFLFIVSAVNFLSYP